MRPVLWGLLICIFCLPLAFVLDVGLVEGRGWAVVEFNPAWCSGLLGADPTAVLSVLPALKNPTVAPLADGEWVAVNTVIEEDTAWSLIPKLKEANAQGIVEYPLNKVVM